jgi:hypothetical protein
LAVKGKRGDAAEMVEPLLVRLEREPLSPPAEEAGAELGVAVA